MADAVLTPEEWLAKQKGSTGEPLTPEAWLAQQQAAEAKPQSWYGKLTDFAGDVGRQVGLTARIPVNAVAGTLDMIPQAVNPLVNAVARPLGGTPINPRPFSTMAEQGMNAIGLPQPQNTAERMVQAGGQGMVNAAMMFGLGNVMAAATTPLAKAVASTLMAAPRTQVVSGLTSGLSGQGATEMGAGPGLSTLASLVGGALPSVPSAVGAGTRSFARGPDTNVPNMQERMAILKEAGITEPSAGQVTGGRGAQATESVLAKMPGGAGPMHETAMRQNAQLGAKAEAVADSLSSIQDPKNAGVIIEKGVGGKGGLTGDGGFMDRFKAMQNTLYNKVDQYIPKQRAVNISRTKDLLQEMNADIPNAPALSKWFKNAKIIGLEEALKSDTGGTPGVAATPSTIGSPTSSGKFKAAIPGTPGTPPGAPTAELPYESIKKLRTLVGGELENAMTSDVPRSKWKALYASLSQDLEDAVKATGNKDAMKAVKRANDFTRAGHERVDTVLNDVEGKKVGEQVYRAATGDMKDGASKIQAVIKSLKPDERDVVRATFIRRLGLATAGNQNAEGTTFSPNTFLTKWNNLSPSAKDALFVGGDGAVRKSLDAIAKTSQFIKEGSKVFANPSGTAPAAAVMGEVTGASSAFFGGLATGHPILGTLVASGIGAQALTANYIAKNMTNPAFLKWLEKSVALPPALVPAALNSLTRNMTEDEKVEASDFVNDVAAAAAKAQADAQAKAPSTQRPLSAQMQGVQP